MAAGPWPGGSRRWCLAWRLPRHCSSGGCRYFAKTLVRRLRGAGQHLRRPPPPACCSSCWWACTSYTFTLTGSLHGLRHYQALIVNVCGSSVGNLLPGGGAAGLAVTYTICRSWGFSRRDISTSAIVTGVWNILARVALPVVGDRRADGGHGERAGSRFAAPPSRQPAAWHPGHVRLGASPRSGPPWPSGTGSTGPAPTDAPRGTHDEHAGPGASTCGRASTRWCRSGWLQMTLGLAGFFAVYFVLFWLCLRSTGVEMFYGQMFAAYAIGPPADRGGRHARGRGRDRDGHGGGAGGLGCDPARHGRGGAVLGLHAPDGDPARERSAGSPGALSPSSRRRDAAPGQGSSTQPQQLPAPPPSAVPAPGKRRRGPA